MGLTCDDCGPAGSGVSSTLTASSADGPRRRSRSTGSVESVERLARSSPVPSQAQSGASTQRRVSDQTRDRLRNGVDGARRRLRRTAPRVIALLVFAAIVAALALPSVLPARPATPAFAASVGTLDFSYQANGVKAPTGRKPEAAKLWVTDGSWWGVLFDRSRDAYMIYRFDWDANDWISTGQMVTG